MRVEKVSVDNCLEDIEFQDWLVEEKLMRRLNNSHIDVQIEDFSTTSPIFEELLKNFGYIVPTVRLTDCINATQIREGGAAVSRSIRRLRTIIDPSEILHAKEVGYGLGVQDFKLKGPQIPLVYYLWQNMCEFVPQESLAQTIYGISGHFEWCNVRDIVSDLRREVLPSTGLEIDTRNKAGRYYQLRYRDAAPDSVNHLRYHVPDYLPLGFQEWIAQEKVGLIERKGKKRHILQQIANRVKRFGVDQVAIAKILAHYWGLLVPTTYLSRLIYGNESNHPGIRESIYRLRSKLDDPSDVYSYIGYGYAIGISDVKLTRPPLAMLHSLWTCFGEVVPREIIEQRLNNEKLRKSEFTFTKSLTTLRRALRGSNYEVAGDSKGTIYMLREIH
jgi:hypothetical protein